MKQVSTRVNIFSSFFLHLHPPTVPTSTLRFGLSLGLGGMAVTLLGVMFLSGLLQLISYSPQPENAYSSIQQLYRMGEIGGFIRNVHYWGGNLLIIIIFFHVLRVFFTGALDQKRRANWLIGICLFVLLLFANFTGYLLPWDQLAYWAVTIFTNMFAYVPVAGEELATICRGGDEVGANTLRLFFGLHIGVLPIALVCLMILHFWLVRKAGGLIRKEKAVEERVRTIPHLLVREAATALILVAILFTFAAFVDAPLADPANSGQSPNPAKAAWYFLGLQELLLHLHPTVAICLIPSLMLFFFAGTPFIKNGILPGGIWFGGQKGGRLAVSVFLGTTIITAITVIMDEKVLHGSGLLQNVDLWLNRGVYPLGIILLLITILYFALNRFLSYSKAEAVMAIFVINIALITTLTVIGIWFRGGGMVLVYPF